MAFSDVLSNKLAELQRAALDAYDEWLTTRTSNDLTISDDRTRVSEDQGVLDPETIVEEQEEYERFVSDLDALIERFAKYYPLDLEELSDVRDRLCREDVSALSEHWGADPYSGEQPRKIVDRIFYAADIVLQMSEPEGLRSGGFWSGPAANAFNDNFLAPFGELAARQVFCGIYLANVVRVFRNATRRTQNDVKAIADACISALRHEGGSLSEDLSDASLFADLTAFILPEPLDTFADIASIALGQAADAAGRHQEPPEWSVEGSGELAPWTAIESTMEVLTRLEDRLARDDDRLYADITDDASEFFYSADFETRPEEPNPPGQAEGEFLEALVETVYEYGAYYLPTAAAQYAEARNLLEECIIPEWFTELVYPRSKSEFTVARNGLRPALVWTHDYLIDGGEALVTISNEYVFQDAGNAASFADVKAELPPPASADYPYEPPPTQRPPRELPD